MKSVYLNLLISFLLLNTSITWAHSAVSNAASGMVDSLATRTRAAAPPLPVLKPVAGSPDLATVAAAGVSPPNLTMLRQQTMRSLDGSLATSAERAKIEALMAKAQGDINFHPDQYRLIAPGAAHRRLQGTGGTKDYMAVASGRGEGSLGKATYLPGTQEKSVFSHLGGKVQWDKSRKVERPGFQHATTSHQAFGRNSRATGKSEFVRKNDQNGSLTEFSSFSSSESVGGPN